MSRLPLIDRQDGPDQVLPCGSAGPWCCVVVRSRIEPPTFRFSGLRITVQDWPQRSPGLLSDLRYTLIDVGVHI